MGLVKCPRCELNYMLDTDKMCSVCKKDVRGEQEEDDMIELCSECGENPVIPGQELCAYCLKELQRHSGMSMDDTGSGESSNHDFDSGTRDITIDSVSSMDEIEVDVDDEQDGEKFDGEEDFFGDDDDDDDEDEDKEDI